MKSTYPTLHLPRFTSALFRTPPDERVHPTPPAALTSTATQRITRLLLGLLLAVICAAGAGAQSYTPTDILVPDGGSFRADAMNDNGEVVGGYTPAGGLEQPVVWRNGVLTQLPLLPGGESGWARGINNFGQMVGGCRTVQPDGTVLPRPCIWENGTVRALPSVAETTYSAAWAINDVGTIVGHGYTPLTYNSEHREAVIWQGSSVGKLNPPTAGANTWARAIDNFGRVAVSWATDAEQSSGAWHAARWTPVVANGTTGTMTSLASSVTSFASSGRAFDINDGGVVAGEDYSQAVVWDASSRTELGTLGALGSWAAALSLNGAGAAVGYSIADDGSMAGIGTYSAFVWDAQTGMQDLNALLSSSTANAWPGSLSQGLAINSSGQILVSAGAVYVVLTPSSEPPIPPLPAPPSSLSASASNGSVQIDWNPVYSASSYNVKRSTVSGGPYATIAVGVGWNSFVDTAVVNGTRYFYVVSSVNGSYESANSAGTSAKPLATPVAPTNLTATSATGGKGVQLAWRQSISPEIQWSRVFRSTNSGAYVQIGYINAGISYTDSAVSRRNTYSYAVTALNSNRQESPYSNVVTVRIK